MKPDKRFAREIVPMALTASIVGGWVVGALSRNERQTAKAVMVEQNDKIRRLQEIVDGKATVDGAPCACPEVKPADCPAPADSGCADEKDLAANREKLLAANLRACADGAKSVNIMAGTRHTCAEAETIHAVIDEALAACVATLSSTTEPAKIKLAEESVSSLEKSHKNHWITPAACGLK